MEEKNFKVESDFVRDAAIAVKDYLYRVGDATSQLANVAILLGDNPNESISSRSYRQRESVVWNTARIGIDLLFRVIEKEHCKSAYHRDLQRAAELIAK